MVNASLTANLHVTGHLGVWRPRQPREPSTTKNSSSSTARKIRAPRDSTPLGRVRKMMQNSPKSTQFGFQIVSRTESEAPPLRSARTGMSTTLSVNATAEHCLNHGHRRQQPCYCCGTTGMFGNLSRELTRARTVRLGLLEQTLKDHSDVHNTTGAAHAAIPLFSALSVPTLVVAQDGHDNEVQELQLWNFNGLQHNSAVHTCLCVATGIATTLLVN